MDIGLVFALLAAFIFSLSTVSMRRGMFQAGESLTGVLISITIGMVFFSVVILITGDWRELFSLTWQAFTLLGAAGIIHFVLGRIFNYTAWRLIGANISTAIIRTQMFYTVILGIILLKEPLTIFLISGVLCIAIGATLVSLSKQQETATRIHIKGILAALGGAFCWGISPVLVKPAVVELGSPAAAAFVSFLVAFLVVVGLLFHRNEREQLLHLDRQSWIPIAIAGVLTTLGQLLLYTALKYSPASVVTPIRGTQVLFVFFLSFLVNRRIEVFTWKIFIGIVVTVLGTFLLFQ